MNGYLTNVVFLEVLLPQSSIQYSRDVTLTFDLSYTGDMVDPSKNPTVYRSPKDYDTLVQNASLQTGKEATFKPIFKRQLEYSIKVRNKLDIFNYHSL